MSVSTIRTRPPASAIVTPRLMAVVVFPSWGLGLVTTIVLSGRSGDMKRMLVRIDRQHSAATDFGSRNTPEIALAQVVALLHGLRRRATRR